LTYREAIVGLLGAVYRDGDLPSEAEATFLATLEGHDRVFGARPLRRVIASRIEDQLSELLLRGKIARGDRVWSTSIRAAASLSTPSCARKEIASEDSRPPSGALAQTGRSPARAIPRAISVQPIEPAHT